MIDFLDTELTTIRKSFETVYFIDNFIRVLDPRKNEPVPFKLYSKQKAVILGIQEYDHNLLLTSRQVGGSSLICALALWEAVFRADKTIVVTSHRQASAFELNHKTQIMYDNLPEIFTRGLELDYRNKHALEFNNGSRIIFDTVTVATCRGVSFSSLYCDNFAFVKESIAEEFFTAVAPSMAVGSKATFASCMNYAPNYFSRLWSDADQDRLNTFNQMTLLWSEIKNEQSKKSI